MSLESRDVILITPIYYVRHIGGDDRSTRTEIMYIYLTTYYVYVAQ